jgi:hypothetical protein
MGEPVGVAACGGRGRRRRGGGGGERRKREAACGGARAGRGTRRARWGPAACALGSGGGTGGRRGRDGVREKKRNRRVRAVWRRGAVRTTITIPPF